MWSGGLNSGSAAPFNFLPKPCRPDPSTCRPKSSTIRVGSSRMPAADTEASTDASYYELLGVPQSAAHQQIKQAYKQLARRYHPDVSPPGRVDEYTRKFILVQRAYETLSDPSSRAAYNRNMSPGLRLAYSSGNGRYNEGEWRNGWQAQLAELERRSKNKESGEGSNTWGAQMRRKRNQSSSR